MDLEVSYRALVCCIIVFVGCTAADDGSTVAGSPRCEKLCRVAEPDIAGAMDVCSETSADACLRDCGERVMDLSAACTACLTADACFDPYCQGQHKPSWSCDGLTGQCAVYGRNSEKCTFQKGDDQGKEACMRQLYPRREVACMPNYPSVASCSAVCAP